MVDLLPPYIFVMELKRIIEPNINGNLLSQLLKSANERNPYQETDKLINPTNLQKLIGLVCDMPVSQALENLDKSLRLISLGYITLLDMLTLQDLFEYNLTIITEDSFAINTKVVYLYGNIIDFYLLTIQLCTRNNNLQLNRLGKLIYDDLCLSGLTKLWCGCKIQSDKNRFLILENK